MNIQTTIRLSKMKDLLKEGKTLEVGVVKHRITDGMSLDCVEEYNPDMLCNLNNESIPSKDNIFDCVVAGELLEHMINPYETVREFYRILKENGVLVLSVPNICSLVSRINMLRGKLPLACASPVDEVTPERHLVDFNKDKIVEVLEKAGFKIDVVTSNGLITHSKLITKHIPASMGETLIVRARK